MHEFFERHEARLDKALDACEKRYAWTAFVESPSSKIHGAEVPRRAKEDFAALLGRPFELDVPGAVGTVGEEISPFTNEPLGIAYPKVDVTTTMSAAERASQSWRKTGSDERIGVCLEILDALSSAPELFLNAYATMHTAGQSFIMAYAGCGANALDRGLEALAYATKAMRDVPESAHWERRFGAGPPASLDKEFRLIPRGVGVVITCATFPQWNGYPAIIANLATGNASVVKPHPNCILPVALFVRNMRRVLSNAGADPNLVTMAADTRESPVTMELLEHDSTEIVDFTGGPAFGRWIEEHCRDALVYTETAGCNSVVVDSTDDLDAMCEAIAHSLCQASAQMCTSVQNIFVPRDGIDVSGEHVDADRVSECLVAAVESHLADPKRAAFLCGALVDPSIYDRLERLRTAGQERGRVLRDSSRYPHPDYPDANTATPLMLEIDAADRDLYGQEHFGPVSFVILADDRDRALARATDDVREHGAITSHVYSTDAEFLERAQDAYCNAGASLACNLTGMPINFAAAYSDYHVTGMNPAGNACLTDLAFVASRFRIAQIKYPSR